MKKKTKKVAIWICLLAFVIPFLFWCGALVKDCLVTAIYKDQFNSIKLAETEEPLSEFDWYRITSYSEEEIVIYFVNTIGKGTDGEYKVGGEMVFSKTPNGWYHTDMVDSILWSGAGSADNYIWPYWHHIFLS